MSVALTKFIESVCVQEAWYWADDAAKPDGYGGYDYDTPEKVKCRWDDKTQMVTNQNGEQVVSNAEILVIEDLKLGGILQRVDDPNEQTPETPTKGWKIVRIEKVPFFRSRDRFVRTVFV